MSKQYYSTLLFSACQTKGPKYFKNYTVSYCVFHKDTLVATRLEYAIEQKYLERRQKPLRPGKFSQHCLSCEDNHLSQQSPPPPPPLQSGQVKQTP